MSTIRSKIVTIRKEQKCYSCFRKFPIGTKMDYWVGTYEGDFGSVYSCLTCQEIMGLDSECEFPEGYVYESLSKGETPEEYLQKLNELK